MLFPLNDNIELFGEVNLLSGNYTPKKGERTKSTFNGVDELPGMTIAAREFEFVKEVTFDSNSEFSNSEPSKRLEQIFPMSSLGFNVGLRIIL